MNVENSVRETRGPRGDANAFGQTTGFPVAGWLERPRPPRTTMAGRTCVLEPLDAGRHAADLYAAIRGDRGEALWTYLSYGPFDSPGAYHAWVAGMSQGDDPLFFAIVDREREKAVGVASYLRTEPAEGVIEVGHINLAPCLQKTTAATEAMYLMMRRVFDELGYRRYEWKCDALNSGSRAAAERLGFRFEGIFRQAAVYKGRNRDTAWYSILDCEWPVQRTAFERWLDPDNFDDGGQQKVSLIDLMQKREHGDANAAIPAGGR